MRAILKVKVTSVVILLILLISFIVFFFKYGLPWNYFSERQEAETYLEEKYEEDFIIEEYQYVVFRANYFGYAHSVEWPEVSFYVGEDNQTKELSDAYHTALWQYQAKREWNPVLEQIFPDNTGYNASLFKYGGEIARPVPDIPNYKEMEGIGIEFAIFLENTTLTSANQEEKLKKIFELISKAREKGLHIDELLVYFAEKTIFLGPHNNADISSIEDYTDLKKWIGEGE